MKFNKVPRINRRTKKPDGWRYIFRKYNPETQRTEPVPVKQLPAHIRYCQSDEIAEAYCKSKLAEEDAIKFRAKKRLEWKTKYANFEKLLVKFEKWQAKNAPNSYKNDVFYLEKYALHFFLDEKQSHDINNLDVWSLFYDDFKKWLGEVKPLKWNRDKLALNTQNRIIKALNMFLEMVGKDLEKKFPKCPQHSFDDLPRVSAEDILSETEIKSVLASLKSESQISYEFFIVLLRSGLRINEALGLNPAFVFEGHIDGAKSKKIHETLKRYDKHDYHGYICLESQPVFNCPRIEKAFKDRFGTTWQAGSVPRKPLKHRKKIEPENYRFIPIWDKSAWNILAKRFNDTAEIFEKAKKEKKNQTLDVRDYLIFDGLTKNIFYKHIASAFKNSGVRFRSPHKLRHTFLTSFYDGTDENRFLAKKVAGHSEERSMEVYSHLNEQMGLEQKRKIQTEKRLKII